MAIAEEMPEKLISSSAARELEPAIFKKPSDEVLVSLGRIEAEKQLELLLPIVNSSTDVFTLNDAKSSCGCVVGFLKDETLAPAERSSLMIRIQPGRSEGEFNRTLALLGAAGTGRAWVIKITAEVVPLVSVSPQTCVLDAESFTGPVKFTANFNLELCDPKVMSSSNLSWELEMSTKTEAQYKVTGTARLKRWLDSGTQIERIVFRPNSTNDRLLNLAIPFSVVSETRVQPTTVLLSDEKRQIAFFVVGDVSKIGVDGLVAKNQHGTVIGVTKFELRSERTGKATCSLLDDANLEFLDGVSRITIERVVDAKKIAELGVELR